MDDGAALRSAIRGSPADATVRLVYADWLDEHARPEGELVRLLCEPASRTDRDVMGWFLRNAGWPVSDRLAAREWLFVALLDPARWPSAEAHRACVAAMVGRLLPGARRWLPAGYSHLEVLERAVGGSDLPSLGGLVCSLELVAEILLAGPADGAGEAANSEMCEQVHVVGWAWLGLPPLRPPVPVEHAEPFFGIPPEPAPAPPPRPVVRPWWRRLFGR